MDRGVMLPHDFHSIWPVAGPLAVAVAKVPPCGPAAGCDAAAAPAAESADVVPGATGCGAAGAAGPFEIGTVTEYDRSDCLITSSASHGFSRFTPVRSHGSVRRLSAMCGKKLSGESVLPGAG